VIVGQTGYESRELMTLRHTLGFVTVAVALVGCARAIDPAAKADVDARVAALRPSSMAVPPPASDADESMPLAVGQWAEYKIMRHDGQPSFLTQKIVGQVNGAYLVEITHDTYQGHTAQQLEVVIGDRRDAAKVELRAVKEMDAKGRVTTRSKADLWVARNHMGPVDLYRDDAVAVSLVVRWHGESQAPTVVAAGHFEGCYYTSGTQVRRQKPVVTEAWSHPTVPISGLVRKQDDRGFVSELVAHGTSGARSEF
jgi:hypothetical protein